VYKGEPLPVGWCTFAAVEMLEGVAAVLLYT
jgi:hypothetical protein